MVEDFRCRLRTNAGRAWNVVYRIPGQRQIVNDLMWLNAKFFFDIAGPGIVVRGEVPEKILIAL